MFTKTDIEKYFIAEKNSSLIFLIIGIVAILIAAGFFFFWKTNFAKGAAVPLLIFGLIQAGAGYTVYARSDNQRIDNVYAFDMKPSKLKNEELPRMKTVNRNFVIYHWIEIAFIITGIILIVLYKSNEEKIFLYGFGITLMIQSAILLGADYLAAKRSIIYTQQLETLIKK
jgi:drug/metabolite transporter (DMT)-like permease